MKAAGQVVGDYIQLLDKVVNANIRQLRPRAIPMRPGVSELDLTKQGAGIIEIKRRGLDGFIDRANIKTPDGYRIEVDSFTKLLPVEYTEPLIDRATGKVLAGTKTTKGFEPQFRNDATITNNNGSELEYEDTFQKPLNDLVNFLNNMVRSKIL